jgi:hypothetical protein
LSGRASILQAGDHENLRDLLDVLLARAMLDHAFRSRLLDDVNTLLQECQIELPAGTDISAHESTGGAISLKVCVQAAAPDP